MQASQPVAKVVLHGRLRRKFGPEFKMAASTSARAFHWLIIMVPGFREEIEKGDYRVIRGSIRKGVPIDVRGLHLKLPASGEVHIMPVAKGRKSGAGTGKIIVGVILVIAAVVMPYLAPAWFGAYGALTGGAIGLSVGTVFGTTVLTGVALFGGMMILGGVAQLLSTQAKTSAAGGQSDALTSALLGGSLNVAEQGVPVPVIYGRTMVGSVVVSLGYEAAQFFDDSVAQPGSVDTHSGFSGNTGAGSMMGGGGSTPSSPVDSPNTLRSNATVRIIDLLGEGPIGGLVDGPKSIFFNDTPLMANDGTWNFQGVSYVVFLGFPDQDPIPGFSASEETQSVQTPVLANAPVIRTIQSDTANAVRVTIQIPAMFDQDQSTGNTNPTDLTYSIDIRASRSGVGGWSWDWSNALVLEDIHGGKCTSPYERSHRITLPGVFEGANTWDVRVNRITPDSNRVTLVNAFNFELMSIITDHKIMYGDSAGIALTFDAKSFGSSLPTRTYLIDGREVAVPLNYDPVGRTYAASGPGTTGGTWDSFSFKNVVTSNPTWILYDMLTHERYGAGLKTAGLETTRATLYIISQYCDGLVPDGFGGTEPRYAVNVVINSQQDAYVLLQLMVSAFRGMTYWGAGQVMVSADMPKNPVKLVNQTNVIAGNFDYQSSSLKVRHNTIRVTWKDPAHQYQPTPEIVEDTPDIARRSVLATDLVAFGCTSRGLARRLGNWVLYTEMHQTETLQYDAGLYHLDLRPGDIFQQHDPGYFGLRWGGRLRSSSTQAVLNLDTLFDPDIGTTFAVTVVMPDNTVAQSVFPKSSLVTIHSAANLIPNSTMEGSVVGTPGTLPDGWSRSGGSTIVPSVVGRGVESGRQYIDLRFVGTTAAGNGNTNIVFVSSLPATSGQQWTLSFYSRLIAGSLTNVLSITALMQDNITGHQPSLPLPTTTIQRVTAVATTSISGVTQFTTVGFQVAASFSSAIDFTIRVSGPQMELGGIATAYVAYDGYTSINLVAGLPQQPSPNAEWIILDQEVAPRLFQAISIASSNPGQFTVNAVNYDPQKFSVVELGVTFVPQTFSILPALLVAAVPPPTNVAAMDYLVGVGNTTVIRVTVSWTLPNDPRIDYFQVRADGASFSQLYRADGATKDIDGLVPGTYTFSVRSVGRSGSTSVWADATPILVDGLSDPPDIPLGVTAVGGTRRVQLTWFAVPQRDIKYYEIWRSPSVSGAPTGYSLLAFVAATKFTDSDSDVLLPNTTWWYRVRAVTTTDVAGGFSAQVSALTTFLVADDLADGIINTAKFASSIKPVGLVTDLSSPGLPGAIVYNETDGQLYQWKIDAGHPAGAWVPYIDLTTIHGQVAAAQILGMEASKLIGTLTDAQIASLNAAKLTGQITSTQITDGSISTPKLAAGAVTAANIAAGAITTSMLSVGAPSNVVWNSCLELTGDGWAFGSSGTFFAGANVGPGPVLGTVWDPTWRIPGIGSGVIATHSIPAGNIAYGIWAPNYPDDSAAGFMSMPVVPGQTVEAQARLLPIGYPAQIVIDLWAADRVTQIGGSGVGNLVVNRGQANGQTLAQYDISWATIDIPSGVAFARIYVRLYNNTGSAGGDGYLFFTQVSLGQTVPNPTQPQPYAPGGVTSITGSIIKSRTILASRIAVGTLTATEIAARSVTADRIAALSLTANEMAANSIIAGKIAAGAISATEIATNAIRTVHLAADFQLTLSSQIGTAVIGSAQIGDATITHAKIGSLEVNTDNLANSSVTNFGSAYGTYVTVFVPSGASVVIFGLIQGGFGDSSGSGGVTVNWGSLNIYRNGSIIYSAPQTNDAPNTYIWLDTPGAGYFSYQANRTFQTSPGNASSPIIVMVVKK